jgi:ER membrane protein complex subunit 8/9
MPAYVLSHKVYLSLLLHAAKHPHKPVNGVLLGKSGSADTVDVVATVPLVHAWTSLSPMMEIGLDLVGTIRTLGAVSGKLSRLCRQRRSRKLKA